MSFHPKSMDKASMDLRQSSPLEWANSDPMTEEASDGGVVQGNTDVSAKGLVSTSPKETEAVVGILLKESDNLDFEGIL